MLEALGLVSAGFIIGAFGTMVGIGGGPILVPFLILFFKMVPVDVIATSLFVVLLNVFAGTMYYTKQKRIDIVSGTKFGIVGAPFALIGTFVPQFFTARFFEVLFSIVLFIMTVNILIPVVEGLYLKKKPSRFSIKNNINEFSTLIGKRFSNNGFPQRVIIDSEGNRYTYHVNEKLGLFTSAIIGFLNPILGIGGGAIHMPVLIRLLQFPVHIAIGTCHYILLVCLPFALVPYVAIDAVQWSIALPLGVGAVFGARVGAGLSNKYSGDLLLALLGGALLLLAFRLLIFG